MDAQFNHDVANANDDSVTLSITLAYNGRPFCGFARQPGQLTVQGELETALQTLFRIPIETTCAGRTDAGVHARCQVVSFDVPSECLEGRNTANILRSLNALTHDCISIRKLEKRDQGFSARFDAISREYRYFIFPHSYSPVFANDFCWHISKPLDIDAMEEAASYLIGEHDFKSFCMAISAKGRRTYRYVDEISFHEFELCGQRMIYIKVVGNAFLHSMVRAIVGTLVAVGKGLKDPSWVRDVLEARDRKAAGENAPASGLVLWDVAYQNAFE